MRFYPFTALSIILLAGCVFTPQAPQTYTLSILHTNDLHSHLLPSDNQRQLCTEPQHCFGGYAKIASFIKSAKKQHSNTLVLDAGDRFSGTVFYTLRKGKDIADLTNDLQYDVLTIGNHEFDDGVGEFESFANTVTMPIVSANVHFPKHPELDSKITNSVILEKNGQKIGIIGALSEETKEECAHAQDIVLSDVITSVKSEVQKLTKQNVHILIGLTHIGIENDIELAKQIPELDIIVGGHSHSLLSNQPKKDERYGPYPILIHHSPYKKTAIVTAGFAGHHVGQLLATFNQNGDIISISGDTIAMDSAIKNDSHIQEKITTIQQNIQSIIDAPIFSSLYTISMTGDKNYCSESCHIGEVLTDALMHGTQSHSVDLVFLNAGGIRAGLPKQTVTFQHLSQSFPFDSQAVLVSMTGNEIKQYITYGLQKYNPDARTNAMLHISGGRYTFNPKTRQPTQIYVGNQPLIENKRYNVVLPLFIAEGGDGFPVIHTYNIISDSIFHTIRTSLNTNSKLIKPLENRIISINQ